MNDMYSEQFRMPERTYYSRPQWTDNTIKHWPKRDDEDGTGGVREPRRPNKPAAPAAMAKELTHAGW